MKINHIISKAVLAALLVGSVGAFAAPTSVTVIVKAEKKSGDWFNAASDDGGLTLFCNNNPNGGHGGAPYTLFVKSGATRVFNLDVSSCQTSWQINFDVYNKKQTGCWVLAQFNSKGLTEKQADCAIAPDITVSGNVINITLPVIPKE